MFRLTCLALLIAVPCGTLACSGAGTSIMPSLAAPSAANQLNHDDQRGAGATAAEPPFNVQAILSGDGFGLVKFRQEKDAAANIVTLDVSVRGLAPHSSYSLQRAVDTVLDGTCTGTNWLTLGQGLSAQPILTDDRGTGSADLWRDLSAFAPGSAFDIYFRVIEEETTNVVLQSACYRFVVRD